MLFNSLQFTIFLPLFVGLYYLVKPRFRWILLFIGSCYFYMAFVPRYIVILFFIILIDYFAAIAIERSLPRRRKIYLIISLLSNIILLAFFKYFQFINENIASIFELLGGTYTPIDLDILLPIGLSFHTFQSMGYTIEVYRGKQRAERHLGYFANYVLFFPQMVAGPIERYETLGSELRKTTILTYDNIVHGLRLILFGLFVKMTVADNIAPYVDTIYKDPTLHYSGEILVAIFLFSIQIYADFFGYSTIALGCARLLGINIMDNFKTPYLSTSLTEFWTRWHISLSTWFKDYLYIPLGGNRVALPNWCFNIMVVFIVSGLWHGASWTFVFWGGLHGIVLIVERFISQNIQWKPLKNSSLQNVLLVLKTFVLTSFIWVFFRAENFHNVKVIFKALYNNWDLSIHTACPWPGLFFGLMLVGFDILLYNNRIDTILSGWKPYTRWVVYCTLLFCVLAFSSRQEYQFIYFQF